MAAEQRLFYLSYAANLLRGEPGSKPKEARAEGRAVRRRDGSASWRTMSFLKDQHPEMYAQLQQLARRPQPYPRQANDAAGAADCRRISRAHVAGGRNAERGRRCGEPMRFGNRPTASGVAVRPRRSSKPSSTPAPGSTATDPDFTMIDIQAGRGARHARAARRQRRAARRDLAPAILAVLSKGDSTFHEGSGRRELGERIFTDAAPLAARVIVNRVWAWHFGKPLVATPSDFGVQGEKPTHPELLDDLAARFIANGWSLKWLHQEIMLSAAYRQASHPRADACRPIRPTAALADESAAAGCRGVSRLHPAGQRHARSDTLCGISMDLDQPGNNRRTVYARISRGRLNNLLAALRFPRSDDAQPGPRDDHDAAAAAFRHEQRVHAGPGRGPGRRQSRKSRRRGPNRSDVSQGSRARSRPTEVKLAADYLAGGGRWRSMHRLF